MCERLLLSLARFNAQAAATLWCAHDNARTAGKLDGYPQVTFCEALASCTLHWVLTRVILFAQCSLRSLF